MKKVLLLEANSIQSQPIAKSLKKKGYYTIGFCEEELSYGYYSRYLDEKHLTVSSHHEPEKYYVYIIDYLKSNNIDVIIPMSDDSAVFLAMHQEELSKYASFSIPSYNVFMRGYDKNQLMKVCSELTVSHPLTIDLSGDYNLDEMKYPAIIKPNLTTGGRGMCVVENRQVLEDSIIPTVVQYGAAHVQEFVPAGGRQIKVQLLVDSQQMLLCSSVMCKVRMYPVKGGSSCCNYTLKDKTLVEECYRILKYIGWRGFADFDIIEDPRDCSMKIMEINPRVPACIKGAIVAGVDWGEAIVNEVLNTPLSHYEYKENVVLRYLGFDFLWFLKSSNRFNTEPSWFSFFGGHVSYEDLDWSDIKAFVMGTYGNIKKLVNPQFRSAKAGMSSNKRHTGGD